MNESLCESWFSDRFDEHIEAARRLTTIIEPVEVAGNALADAFHCGGHAYFFGNGGSAAQAEHFAAELSGRFQRDRPSLPAVALSSNSAYVTAVSNDYGYETVFARALGTCANPGDVAIGISTSGTSPNIVEGLKAASNSNLLTIGLTGSNKTAVKPWCGVLLSVPADRTARVQELHLICGHSLCKVVE